MVCPQCGNYLDDHTNFCVHCQQYVRPITKEAFLAQEDSKELKELPKDESQPKNSLDGLLSSIKDPKNKFLVILMALSFIGCIVLGVLFFKTYLSYVNLANQPPTIVTNSDIPSKEYITYKKIGMEDYGYTYVPALWINAVYDSTSGNELPSIQYVSVDGKYSVTLSKACESTTTLSSCATNLQKMMIDYFNIEDNDKKKIVKIEKNEINNIQTYCVKGYYTIDGKPNCFIASYLMMDENDKLYMITIASYDQSENLDFLLNRFSFKDPEEEQ